MRVLADRVDDLAARLKRDLGIEPRADSEKLHAHLRDLGVAHEYEILLGVSHNTQAYYDRSGLHGYQFQAAGFARQR